MVCCSLAQKNLLLLPTMTFHDAVISRKYTSPDKKPFFSHIMQKRSRFPFFKKIFLLPCSALIVSFFANEEGKKIRFLWEEEGIIYSTTPFLCGDLKRTRYPLPFLLFQSCACAPVRQSFFLLPQHSGKCRLIMRDIIILYPFFSFSPFKVRRSERRTSANGIRQRSDYWREK